MVHLIGNASAKLMGFLSMCAQPGQSTTTLQDWLPGMEACRAEAVPVQVQRLGSDVQQLEAESQRLLSQNEAAQPNGRSETSSYGGGQGGQTVHSLELLDFSPNWDFTLGGSKVVLIPRPPSSARAMPPTCCQHNPCPTSWCLLGGQPTL